LHTFTNMYRMKYIFTLLISILFTQLSFAQSAEENIVGRDISDDSVAKGVASYYHDKFVGRPTSTGEMFSNEKFTAASNTLSLNTYVKVTNLANGKYLYVRINDRMAKNNKRLIDMASICAKKLDYHNKGLAKVKVEIVPEEEGRNGILAQRTELNTEKAAANKL
jgi:rare lipoprotein A